MARPLLIGVCAFLLATTVASWTCRQALLDLDVDGQATVRLLGLPLYVGERSGDAIALHPQPALLALTFGPALLAGIFGSRTVRDRIDRLRDRLGGGPTPQAA
jgi:hypothetical protein